MVAPLIARLALKREAFNRTALQTAAGLGRETKAARRNPLREGRKVIERELKRAGIDATSDQFADAERKLNPQVRSRIEKAFEAGKPTEAIGIFRQAVSNRLSRAGAITRDVTGTNMTVNVGRRQKGDVDRVIERLVGGEDLDQAVINTAATRTRVTSDMSGPLSGEKSRSFMRYAASQAQGRSIRKELLGLDDDELLQRTLTDLQRAQGNSPIRKASIEDGKVVETIRLAYGEVKIEMDTARLRELNRDEDHLRDFGKGEDIDSTTMRPAMSPFSRVRGFVRAVAQGALRQGDVLRTEPEWQTFLNAILSKVASMSPKAQSAFVDAWNTFADYELFDSYAVGSSAAAMKLHYTQMANYLGIAVPSSARIGIGG